MAAYALIEVLAVSGSRKADGSANASGKVWVYQPGSTTNAPMYSNAEGSAQLTNPVTLSASGKATIFVKDPVRLLVQTSGGTTVSDTTYIPAYAGNVGVRNTGFTGVNPSTGATEAGGDTTVNAVLTSIASSVGGTDGKYKESNGATDRNIQAKLAELSVSARDFGALGNNIQVDTTFAQAAINRVVATSGGVVEFPAGTYVLDAALTVAASTGVTIRGHGAATVLKFTNGTSNGITATSATSLTIENLVIQHSTSSTGVALSLSSCTAPVIRDVVVTEDDFATGVLLTACGRTAIEHSDIGCNDSGGGTGRAIKYTTSGQYHAIYGGTIIRGSGTGTGVEFDLDPAGGGHAAIVGCHFISMAVGVDAGVVSGENVVVLGCTGLGGGAIATPFTDTIGSLIQAFNDVDGYTQQIANAGNHTPNLVKGLAIRFEAQGATATINAPAPVPAFGEGNRLLTTFVNHSGGTTWTLNAAFRTAGAGTAIPTTASHRINVVWSWDSTDAVWRETSRIDMNT